jgi:hypothetical protein
MAVVAVVAALVLAAQVAQAVAVQEARVRVQMAAMQPSIQAVAVVAGLRI